MRGGGHQLCTPRVNIPPKEKVSAAIPCLEGNPPKIRIFLNFLKLPQFFHMPSESFANVCLMSTNVLANIPRKKY